MGVVFSAYSQEHTIDPFVGLGCSRKVFPATATPGMNVRLIHVDVVEVQVALSSSHGKL